MKFIYYLLFLSIAFISSCDEETYIPKPRGFAKTMLPEKKYQQFNNAGYPYSFEYPVYGVVEKDSTFFGEKTENPWWINVTFKEMNGKIYMSYKQLDKEKNTLKKLLEDSHTLSYYHTKRASYINDPEFHTKNNVHGIIYDVGGNAASSFQFYATDSNNHFIRGALYFDVSPNIDSLKPYNAFLQQDVKHLLETLTWK